MKQISIEAHDAAVEILQDRIDKLEKGIADIVKHLEFVGGSACNYSSTYNIAKKLLNTKK